MVFISIRVCCYGLKGNVIIVNKWMSCRVEYLVYGCYYCCVGLLVCV